MAQLYTNNSSEGHIQYPKLGVYTLWDTIFTGTPPKTHMTIENHLFNMIYIFNGFFYIDIGGVVKELYHSSKNPYTFR